jgi:hypothetical protein
MPTRDASSPARVTTVDDGGLNSESGTTASFSPPDDSWLYLSFLGNPTSAGATPTYNTPTNTGTALTWEKILDVNNASGGAVVVWRAYNASAQSGITVSGKITWTVNGLALSGMWVDVWTGCHTAQTGAAVATTTNATTTNNFGVTTTATGSRVVLAGVDWNVTSPAPTSSDTIDSYSTGGATAGGRAYKAADSGAAGAETVNFVWGAGSPIATYGAYEILAANAQSQAPRSMHQYRMRHAA